MYLNKQRVRELMRDYADDNYHEFARQLQVDVAQVHRVLNTESKAGPKLLGNLMKYCQSHKLDFNHYIFLEQPLHTCNGCQEPTGTLG